MTCSRLTEENPFEGIVDRVTCFEMLDQVLEKYACAAKSGRTGHDSRIGRRQLEGVIQQCVAIRVTASIAYAFR